MRTYSQEEIDELIASGEIDRSAERARQFGRSGLTITAPALMALADVARRPPSTDEQIDTAVAAARTAGHTWNEIEPVLHACRTSAPTR